MDTRNSSENQQRRIKHGQRPTEPLAGWPAEFGAVPTAESAQPAATSGDAPPADCSGDPSSCPDNEGYGCHCGYASPATASGDDLPPPKARATEYFSDEPVYSAAEVLEIRRAAVSAATKPAADLSSLQRYGEVAEARGDGEYVIKMEDGEFYRVKDVQSLLATKPAAAPAVPPESEVQAAEARLYRELTGDVVKLGFDGLVAAVKHLTAPAAPEISLVPKWAGQFHSYQDWVNKAQSRLASPDHRRAMCVDAKGRRCAIGKDFMVARDEGAFPVRYFWECEPAASTTGAAQTAEQVRDQALEEAARAFDAGSAFNISEHYAQQRIRALKRSTPTEGEQA